MTPQPTGYSATPLIKKLGIRANDKVLLVNPPAGYFTWLGSNISGQVILKNEKPDFIHLFADDSTKFYREMSKFKKLIKPTTVLWISWYKKASGIKTDMSEDLIRDYALQNALVDVKVCAVSELWSGLKLVVPLSLRK